MDAKVSEVSHSVLQKQIDLLPAIKCNCEKRELTEEPSSIYKIVLMSTLLYELGSLTLLEKKISGK